MIWQDADFWNRYYRWALRTPVQREISKFTLSLESIQLVFADEFSPAIRRAAWAFEDFGFALSLVDKPRWMRPLLKIRHRIASLRRLIG